MLLPWSNTVTLAIAEDGIAIHAAGNAVRMLSNMPSNMLSAQNFLNRNYQAVVDVLQQHEKLLTNQSVRLIMANYLLRFIVLPWQEGVYSRQDWLALASHAFRQQYGAVADSWQIRVSLGGYGQTMVASAMDQALYDGLINTADQLKFRWQAIEPLAMRLLNNPKRDETLWILIAEPQHLLLCETYQGQFQRFSVASPPSGQESIFAAQMIARNQLQLPSQQKPRTTIVHVSGKLNGSWLPQNQTKQTAILSKQPYQYHADWLATL